MVFKLGCKLCILAGFSESRRKEDTAFLTKYGLYEHVRMGFGMTNSPAMFSRVKNLILRGLNWKTVLAFLDDILVMGMNFEDHLNNLAEAFERFKQYGLKLKPRKRILFQSEVEFLGRIVSSNQLKMASKDIATVTEWPVPTTSKEVERFLGLANYHRAFIKNFAGMAQPLYSLTGKNKFKWGNEEQVAFDSLKEALTNPPVLGLPNSEDFLILDTDASEGMVNRIYPPELQLNKANTADTEAPFLDLHLSISSGFVSSKIYDKRDDFDFDIVNFPFLDGDVPRSTSYGVYISQLIRFVRVSSHVVDFNARNKSLTAKLLQQGYRYHKLRKTFSKFYRRHYELVSKFSVGLKTLLHQGLSEPEFYGDLVYKFKKIVGRVDFSDQFRKIIVRYKRIGYNINIMRQSACLVFNPITVNNFASLFNCTPVGRASDSMMAPT